MYGHDEPLQQGGAARSNGLLTGENGNAKFVSQTQIDIIENGARDDNDLGINHFDDDTDSFYSDTESLTASQKSVRAASQRGGLPDASRSGRYARETPAETKRGREGKGCRSILVGAVCVAGGLLLIANDIDTRLASQSEWQRALALTDAPAARDTVGGAASLPGGSRASAQLVAPAKTGRAPPPQAYS